MRIEGSYSFKADRETVWAALQAPDLLSGCIPGCRRFEPAGEDSYEVEATVRVGAISGTYRGKLTITDIVHPLSYKIEVEGSGSGMTLRGEGTLSFSEAGGETVVKVVGDAEVSGIVARVGQRLMGSASRMMMTQFFGCMRSKIEG